MEGKPNIRISRRRLPWVPVLLLLLAIGISINIGSSGTALAGRLTDLSAPAAGSHTQDNVGSAPSSPQDHAYMTVDPSLDTFGSLPTNPNSGDTVNTGDR